MKGFNLIRDRATTPVSGEGVIAQGVKFSDGTIALRWNASDYTFRSTVIWQSISAMMHVHGWDGETRVQWIDDE